ncbi:MAG: hypothetical protein HC842_01265, partial [Cytophagales bacterium]|nr:hypothetical protein [Cytophagales bacterium]
MLTSQAAVSIENALLYDSMEEKVIERTAEVNRQKQEIEIKALQLEETNAIVEKKNKDITSSINYASRIQRAMLP